MSLTIKILRAKLKIERGYFTTKHPSLYVVAKNQYIKFNTDHHQENKVKDNFRYFAWNQTLPMIPNTSNIINMICSDTQVMAYHI